MKKYYVLIAVFIVITIIGYLLPDASTEINYESFEVIDEMEVCAEALEEFYSDETYSYSYNCIRSEATFIKFENAKKMVAKTALEGNLLTIEEFENQINKQNLNIQIYKYEKNK